MDREKNARRKAVRRGYILRKSRLDATWTVIDPWSNSIIGGTENARGDKGWSLKEVEKFLDHE